MANDLVKVDDYGKDLADLIAEIGVVIDYTRIAKYEEQRKHLVSLDVYSAPMYLRDFNEACEYVSKLKTKVDLALSDAKSEMDAEESKAKLERAPKYFEENDTLGGGIKDSSTLRDTYVKTDVIYRRAKQKAEALKALYKFLDDKMEAFKRDHYSVKQIYGTMTGSTDFKNGHNGMPSTGKIGEIIDG